MDPVSPLFDAVRDQGIWGLAFIACGAACGVLVIFGIERLIKRVKRKPLPMLTPGEYRVTIEHRDGWCFSSTDVSDETAGRLIRDLQRDQTTN